MFGRATPSDLNYRYVVRWTVGGQHAGTHSESRFGACWCKNSIRRRTTFPGPSRRPRPAPRAELLHVLMLPDFMLPTSSEPTGSASSGAIRRAAPSPSS
jgi:hypothetical protein